MITSDQWLFVAAPPDAQRSWPRPQVHACTLATGIATILAQRIPAHGPRAGRARCLHARSAIPNSGNDFAGCHGGDHTALRLPSGPLGSSKEHQTVGTVDHKVKHRADVLGILPSPVPVCPWTCMLTETHDESRMAEGPHPSKGSMGQLDPRSATNSGRSTRPLSAPHGSHHQNVGRETGFTTSLDFIGRSISFPGPVLSGRTYERVVNRNKSDDFTCAGAGAD